MNIFAIEGDNNQIDWVGSAKSQDNYRVVKMILESCQMLCTTLNEQHGKQATPYRSTHKNHPSTKWVRSSSANFEALVIHTMAMLEEYTERFGKTHKCTSVLEKCLDIYEPSLFPSQDSTHLPLAMPYEFHSTSIVESYRKFYASKPNVRYPKDKIPEWFKKYRKGIPFDITIADGS
mgnify:CR=1 FL=1|tara:strand:- start:220 stop:750 length:531 start_codon:yes stop_codon:yes gene_type:complete